MTNIVFKSAHSIPRCFVVFLSTKSQHPSHVPNKVTDSPFAMFSYSLTANLIRVESCEEQVLLNKL